MKIRLTNPETIQESEKDFIDAINAELDWEAIEKLLLEKHSFTLQEEIDYKDGDLIVFNDDIAYKFDFEIKVPLSVIFNRQGDCLEISTVRDDFEEDSDFEEEPEIDPEIDKEELSAADLNAEGSSPDPREPEEKVARMASDIADMISEINQPE